MRVFVLVPSFFGNEGSSTNERQLVMGLASKSDTCYVFALTGFKQFFTRQRRDLQVNVPANMVLVPLPIVQPNSIVAHLSMLCISCVMSINALIFNLLFKIDLIYTRSSYLSMGFLSFHSTAKKTVVKIPAIIEDELPNDWLSKNFLRCISPAIDRLALLNAKRVSVNSKSFYDHLIECRSITRKDTPLITSAGVDMALVTKIKAGLEVNSAKSTIDVGFVGSLSWWQGVDVLVKAVAKLGKSFPIRLIIVGDGVCRSSIEALCKSLNISFEITGFVSHEEALRRLSRLDLLVLPRKRTPTTESIIPIKIIEAWALSVPVVVTKHRVFLESNIIGFEGVAYCEPDPESVADAISFVLNHAEVRVRLQRNGPKLAHYFDYCKLAEDLIKA